MDYHGIEMKGTIKVEKLAALPVWVADDEGRFIYDEDTNLFYYGTDSGWSAGGDITESTDNKVTRFNGTTGLQGSGVEIDDSDNVTGVVSLNLIAIGVNNTLARYDLTGGIQDSGISIDDSDNVTGQNSLTMTSCGIMNAGSTPSGVSAMEYNGYFYATRVYNAVFNDIADFQALKMDEPLDYGKCYIESYEGLKLPTERCEMGVSGIATNTYGYGVGTNKEMVQVPIAVCGWVLAYVDKVYKSGTPLTNDKNGNLTEMTHEERINTPERLIATFSREEKATEWGMKDNMIPVNGRHWVRVR